jgi:hypothetical protein
MKIHTGRQGEIVLIPTIELSRSGWKKEYRQKNKHGSMIYFMVFKWLKYKLIISKEFK